MVALQTFKSSQTIYCKTRHKTVEELNLQQRHCEQNISGEKQLCLAAMFSLYILETIWKAEIFHRSVTTHQYSNWWHFHLKSSPVHLPVTTLRTDSWTAEHSAAIIPDHANRTIDGSCKQDNWCQLKESPKQTGSWPPQQGYSASQKPMHWHCINVWNSEGQMCCFSTVLLLLAADEGCSICNYGK